MIQISAKGRQQRKNGIMWENFQTPKNQHEPRDFEVLTFLHIGKLSQNIHMCTAMGWFSPTDNVCHWSDLGNHQ